MMKKIYSTKAVTQVLYDRDEVIYPEIIMADLDNINPANWDYMAPEYSEIRKISQKITGKHPPIAPYNEYLVVYIESQED